MNERELFELKLQATIDCRAGEFRACEAARLLQRILKNNYLKYYTERLDA